MKYPKLALLAGLGLALTCYTAPAADLAPNDKGIGIDAGNAGSFTFEAPEITNSDGGKEKPVWEAGDKGGVAKYPSGGQVEMNITSKEEITVIFSDPPPNAKSMMFSMGIPASLAGSGTVSTEGNEAKVLPATAEGQHVVTGNVVKELKLADADGSGISIAITSNWYTVQDNRIWNMNVFMFQVLYDMTAHTGEKELVITVKDLK